MSENGRPPVLNSKGFSYLNEYTFLEGLKVGMWKSIAMYSVDLPPLGMSFIQWFNVDSTRSCLAVRGGSILLSLGASRVCAKCISCVSCQSVQFP